METMELKPSNTSYTKKNCKIVVKKGNKVFYKTPSFQFVHHADIDDPAQHEHRYFVPKSMSLWMPMAQYLRSAQNASNVDFYAPNSGFTCHLNTTLRYEGKRYEISVPMDVLTDLKIDNDIPDLTDDDIDKMIS